jgi:hypothetical protein
MDKNVTGQVEFGRNDDECLPILTCVCGIEFPEWDFIISIYPELATACPRCGKKFYFENTIQIFQVE